MNTDIIDKLIAQARARRPDCQVEVEAAQELAKLQTLALAAHLFLGTIDASEAPDGTPLGTAGVTPEQVKAVNDARAAAKQQLRRTLRAAGFRDMDAPPGTATT